MVPFDAETLLRLYAAYNAAIWPAQLAAVEAEQPPVLAAATALAALPSRPIRKDMSPQWRTVKKLLQIPPRMEDDRQPRSSFTDAE